MKITSVTTTAIRMPIPQPLYKTVGAGTRVDWDRRSRVSPKRPTPMLEYVLVRIDCDDGSFGIGEASVDIGFFGHICAAVEPPYSAQTARCDVEATVAQFV